jgi:hypothetical protein
MSAGLRDLLEPLLLRSGVDVMLAGHIHAAQRTCRMARGKCVGNDESGITHVTNGASGMAFSLEPLDPSAAFARSTIIGVHGISLVTVANASAMRISFLANRDGSMMDDVWLLK